MEKTSQKNAQWAKIKAKTIGFLLSDDNHLLFDSVKKYEYNTCNSLEIKVNTLYVLVIEKYLAEIDYYNEDRIWITLHKKCKNSAKNATLAFVEDNVKNVKIENIYNALALMLKSSTCDTSYDYYE